MRKPYQPCSPSVKSTFPGSEAAIPDPQRAEAQAVLGSNGSLHQVVKAECPPTPTDVLDDEGDKISHPSTTGATYATSNDEDDNDWWPAHWPNNIQRGGRYLSRCVKRIEYESDFSDLDGESCF